MVRITAQHLLGITCMSLPVLARAVSAQPPSASPAAETELICPSEDSADCYPRLFQPTKDFQIIKPGQDLPPGLHVRMDMTTGAKEARLNIPMEGDTPEGVIDVPIEQAMVVIPQPDEETISDDKPKIPEKAPAYEAAGKIQPPRDSGAGSDSETFRSAIQTIKTGKGELSSALDELSELAHDLYYGSELAKDESLFEKLACLMTNSNIGDSNHKAASVIGSAMQNNPTALSEVGNFWKQVMYPSCNGVPQDLITRLHSVNSASKGLASYPATLKAQTYALSGLIREPSIRNEFLSNKGMEFLLFVFSEEGSEWNKVRVKVAELIMDNFLDETMGAELGLWPTQPLLENKICESPDRVLQDGCWDYHVAKLGNGQWSTDFSKALKEQRKKNADSVKDREL